MSIKSAKKQMLPRPGCMFGKLSCDEMPDSKLEEAMSTWSVSEFSAWLDDIQDNVKCRAKFLLQTIRLLPTPSTPRKTCSSRVELLDELLRRELPQEEVLFALWRSMTDESETDLFEIICKVRSDLLQYHMDFEHRGNLTLSGKPKGFPVYCVVQKFISNPDICNERLEILISNGSDINARYERGSEETAVHHAALKGEWKIVEYLLKHGANIDIKINDITARDIIKKSNTELISNYPIKQKIPFDTNKKLFEALYESDEDEFLDLLRTNKNIIDMNLHDGRYTMFQLAVLNRLEQAADELIKLGADINIMAGFTKEPILIALNNPSFETLDLFASYRRKINFRFSVDSGTFLNALALECTDRTIGVDDNRITFYGIIEEAIIQKIHISAIDKYHSTALEVLGFQSHNNCTLFHLMLKLGGFLTICENLVLNTRPEIFTSFFDQHFSFVEEYKRGKSAFPWENRSEILEVNYNFLEPLDSYKNKKVVPEMLPFYEICKSKEHQQVLLHPIVTLFLVYKWRKIAFIYIFNFLLYFAFTILYSIFIHRLVNTSHLDAIYDESTRNNTNMTSMNLELESIRYDKGVNLWTFSIIFWIFLLFREIFQACLSYRQYIRNFENYIEIALLISSFLTFLPLFSDTKFIAAIAIALTYIELTLLIGRHPYTGTYITMFVRVAFKSIEILLIFSSFIFAFAFGFYVFFHKANEKNFFQNIWESILKTSVMAAGEFNVEDLKFEYSPITSELMFILFIIFVPIVLMNLLNALAVSDTQRVIDETSLLCCVANIKHYTKIESMWLGYTMDNPGERCYGFAPKEDPNFVLRFLSKLRTYFSVNVLPFPQNPYKNPEGDSVLKIHLDHKYYYPHVYFFYKAPTTTSSYKIIMNPRTLYQYLIYFYFRILLRGNEDNSVQELRLRKYPSLLPDINESIDNLSKNLNEMIDNCNIEQKEIMLSAIEELKTEQNSLLSDMEDNIKTKLKNQSFLNMERVVKNFNTQDQTLKEIIKLSRKQDNEIKKLSSELQELKASMLQMTSDIAFIKNVLSKK